MSSDPAITAVRNPLPAAGGVDPETMAEIRRDAPQAFRTQKRAVTEADYARTAELRSLGATRGRHLPLDGSWHTVFITVDRFDGLPLTNEFETQLRAAIEPYRMAGHDLEVDTPHYVPLEIEMFVCVKPDYFRSDVEAALLEIFSSGTLADGRKGLFQPDFFTFGQTVYLSPLYAAAQAVAGRRLRRNYGLPTPGPARDERPNGWVSGHESPRDRAARERSEFSGARRFQARAGRWQIMATLLNDCGCCEGITAIVPDRLKNRPGPFPDRVTASGRTRDFLGSALAALSDPQFGALRSLTTREPDDFTIALLDGWATLADVLTFYQERIANELWLRTATERDSILRLAQLIGYRLKAGVAAETPLCFLLDETPGAPTEVTLKIGTKVQSVPGADEKPQTFETIEEIDGAHGVGAR